MTPAETNDVRPAWGIWATLAWVVAAYAVSYLGASKVLEIAFGAGSDVSANIGDGRLVALFTLVANPVQIAVLVAAARLRGWRVTDYLALSWPPSREVWLALLWLVVMIAGVDLVLYLAGRDIVTPWQVDTYTSAKASGVLPWYFLAVIVFAPVGEEIAFRGFIYRGLTRRPGREPLVIVGIALAWAAIHLQYDWAGILQVFVIGLLLGWIRWRTGSTALPIAMHMLFNFEATIETVIALEYLR